MSTAVKEEKKVVKEKSGRIYYGKVAIVGPSGTGKSYLSKTADRETTGFINVERKPLPYKADSFKWEGRPKNWSGYMKNLKDYADNNEIKKIIIDSQTGAFEILNRECQTNFSGWDIAKAYNRSVYEYFELLKNIEKDILVISHDELVKVDDGTKQRRMVVHNKEYEGKVERVFTIVLYTGTRIKNSNPEYFLKTYETDSSTKVPEDLFDSPNPLEIPNSAEYIFSALENYYS